MLHCQQALIRTAANQMFYIYLNAGFSDVLCRYSYAISKDMF